MEEKESDPLVCVNLKSPYLDEVLYEQTSSFRRVRKPLVRTVFRPEGFHKEVLFVYPRQFQFSGRVTHPGRSIFVLGRRREDLEKDLF